MVIEQLPTHLHQTLYAAGARGLPFLWRAFSSRAHLLPFWLFEGLLSAPSFLEAALLLGAKNIGDAT
eukprot:1814445-Pyramimonas_sp.AAC.1